MEVRLKENSAQAIQVPDCGVPILVGDTKAEPNSWIVVMRGRVSTFTDMEFVREFEIVHSHGPDLPSNPPPSIARRQRQPRAPKAHAAPEIPLLPPTEVAPGTLAALALQLLGQHGPLTLEQLHLHARKAGRETTTGSLYGVMRSLVNRELVDQDERGGAYRLRPAKKGR